LFYLPGILQGEEDLPYLFHQDSEFSSTTTQGKQLGLDNRSVSTYENKKYVHTCPVCNKTFTRPNHVAKHMQRHTGERPFECGVCGKKLSRMSTLREHMVLHLNK
jgi:uncharacterized Zn-finger protein